MYGISILIVSMAIVAQMMSQTIDEHHFLAGSRPVTTRLS